MTADFKDTEWMVIVQCAGRGDWFVKDKEAHATCVACPVQGKGKN